MKFKRAKFKRMNHTPIVVADIRFCKIYQAAYVILDERGPMQIGPLVQAMREAGHRLSLFKGSTQVRSSIEPHMDVYFIRNPFDERYIQTVNEPIYNPNAPRQTPPKP